MAKDCTETKPMAQIERHFFVCENARPAGGKPSCGARGSAEIATALQEGLGRHPELWGRVAVTSTGSRRSNGNVSTDCFRTVTMSNCSTRYDGTSTRLPLTSK